MGDKGIHLVVNEKGEFREDNFQKAMGMVSKRQGDDPADPNVGKGRKGKTKKGGQKGLCLCYLLTAHVKRVIDRFVGYFKDCRNDYAKKL
jgi:hypothetical protein